MQKKFSSRIEAGKELAQALKTYKDKPDTLIFALPRGGVPVAHEVAKELSLPLDVWIVRKLGLPYEEEVAIGAIAMGGARYINREYVAIGGVSQAMIGNIIAKEEVELERRNTLYRKDKPLPDVKNKTVIIVDDGLATGATMRAAVESVRNLEAKHIIVAVPVGAEDACKMLSALVDEVICLYKPDLFLGVGQWYVNFEQTTDEEVQTILGM